MKMSRWRVDRPDLKFTMLQILTDDSHEYWFKSSRKTEYTSDCQAFETSDLEPISINTAYTMRNDWDAKCISSVEDPEK